MYKLEKQKTEISFFDVEKERKKNNTALQRLLKFNAELENATDRRSRYQNPKKLEKDEKAFFKSCEKRLYNLNLESDFWIDEEQKLQSLYRRRAMLSDVLKTTNEQLIEEAVMKSLNQGAQQQQERLEVLNKELRKDIGVTSRQYVEQRRLFELFIERENINKEMMVIQDNCFKEIRQKLKMYSLVTIKKKVNPDSEQVNEAIRKNQKLENILRQLSQQAIDVPMLKYRYICAADERRRITALNGELETVVLVLTERLADHTGWEFAFKDMERNLKVQQKAMNTRLQKIEELKAATKLGTKSMFSLFSKENIGREKLTRRLDLFRTKVYALQREYRTFQPEIEAFLKDLKASSHAAKSETPVKKTGNTPKTSKAKESKTSKAMESKTSKAMESKTSKAMDSSTDSDYDFSDSDESSDYNNSSQKDKFRNVSFHPTNQRKGGPKPTETPGSRTSLEDSAESGRQWRNRTHSLPRLIAERPTSRADSEGSDRAPSATSSARTQPSLSWWEYFF